MAATIIYNLFPRLAGNFNQWDAHIKRASDMGFTWIFLNPVQMAGFSGSLYSIKDYFALNADFVDPGDKATPDEQLKAVIERGKSMGLRFMIDLVINHCAVDSELIKTSPQWFEWEHKGKVMNPFCYEDQKKITWGDLAKFDHARTKDKEGLYAYVKRIVEHLVALGFDGFRCDAAYQVPGELWHRLIKEIKGAHPQVSFFAETLGCSPQQTRQTARAGFDFIFNSSKWWDFHSPWLMEQYNLTREAARSVAFPESHDTVRLAQELNGCVDGLKQRYLFSSVFSSGVMVPVGFEFGFRGRPHVVKSRPEHWEGQSGIDICQFIAATNRMKSAYAVFHEECPMEVLHHHNPNVLFLWKASTTTSQEALVILNKDIYNKQYFRCERLSHCAQSQGPFTDVSPEYHLDYIPEPFEYDLRPGQGIVLVSGA